MNEKIVNRHDISDIPTVRGYGNSGGSISSSSGIFSGNLSVPKVDEIIYTVDMIREDMHDNTVLLSIINLDTGNIKTIKNFSNKEANLTYSEIAFRLMELVFDNKPKSIIFDTVGLGVVMKDAFYSLCNKNWSNISVDSVGKLNYWK